jgi:hypothetical protein
MAKRNGGIIGPSNVPNPFIAKGVWKLSEAFNYQKAGLWPPVLGYQVNNSLRFNEPSSDNLSRTPASASNRKTWTWSGWLKRSSYGATSNPLFAAGVSTDRLLIQINSSDVFTIVSRISSVDTTLRTTTQVFRDSSAWYHIVVAFDTTQATANDRLKLYVNGSQVTSFTTTNNLSQNADSFINNNIAHYIGNTAGTGYLNGYLSEINFIDGQQLTPSSFGETDTLTGIWTPIAYTGSFGTNGFELEFKNSAALGTDTSGNGNTWTANNLTSIDQTTDTPTNNFATLNSLDRSSTAPSTILSEGNTVAEYGTTSLVSGNVWGTIGVNTGKWYAEFNLSTYLGSSTLRCGFVKFTNTTGATKDVSATGIYMVALDLINSLYWVGTNGVWDAGDPSAGTGGTSLTPSEDFYTIAVRDNSGTVGNGGTWKLNTGNPAFTIVSGNTDSSGFGNFEYAVPSGYYALCTKNLAAYG